MTFAGFPARAKATAIPNVFFSDVLPRLAGDPVAVGVALFAFNKLMAKRGFPRDLTGAELSADASLVAYLAACGALNGDDAERQRAVIDDGLRRCVEAGMLLVLVQQEGEVDTARYFLNTPADRRGMETARAQAPRSARIVPFPAATAEKRGIFALYEQEIGTLTPQITEELIEAEQLYPAEWIERAFKEAAAHNARAWRYVQRILERWAIEGPDHATTERDPAAGERYFRGKYGSILRRRLDG